MENEMDKFSIIGILIVLWALLIGLLAWTIYGFWIVGPLAAIALFVWIGFVFLTVGVTNEMVSDFKKLK